MNKPTRQLESPWPHRVAVLLTCAVFPLIWVGSLVTTYNAGMAVPDWPSTYGYNLFLYPWETWWYGPWDLFIEHGHRLLGALVGLITIALLVLVWRRQNWVTVAAGGALLLVCIQGALGGMRVLFDARQLALIHGCVGPLFFAYCAAFAVALSPWWKKAEPVPGGDRVKRLSLMTLGVSYFQLILGANLRHLGPDSPFRSLVAFHIFVALALLVHAFLLAISISWSHAQQPALLWPSLLLLLLVTAQIALGGATFIVNYSLPNWELLVPAAPGYTIEAEGRLQTNVVTLHVAMGSLILALTAAITVRVWRLFRGSDLIEAAGGAA